MQLSSKSRIKHENIKIVNSTKGYHVIFAMDSLKITAHAPQS